MKKCPFCAEEIQDEAVKCRYCNEFLDGSGTVSHPREAASSPPPRPKVPWYYSPTIWVIGFLAVGPLILPLVWMNPHYSRQKKIWISVGMLFVSWILFKALSYSFCSLKSYYSILKGIY